MAQGKQVSHTVSQARESARQPLTPGKGTAGGEQDWRPRGFPGMVTQCAFRPDDTTLSVNEQATKSALCSVLVGGWVTAGLDQSLLHSLHVLLQLRVSLGSLRPGTNYSGFLTGSFLRMSCTHQEGSRSDVSKKTCSPVSSRAGLCNFTRYTDHQGFRSNADSGSQSTGGAKNLSSSKL